MKKIRTITQVKREIDALIGWYALTSDIRVRQLIAQIRKENAGKVAELQKELAVLEANKPKPKPRWPESTPESVVAECAAYWKGTEAFHKFRIHCWNDKVICTGYPSGGYSDNCGWHRTPATFEFIRRVEKQYDRAKYLARLEGRQSAAALQQELEALSQRA